MADDAATEKASEAPEGWPIHEAWESYEQIAMHFNDLLIRLRIQALGGIAALSTLVGIFTKTDTKTTQGSWEIAAAVFGALCLFWIAIWILDIKYYNKLLLGSVGAILELERQSATTTHVRQINMSTLIAAAFVTPKPEDIPKEPQEIKNQPRPLTGIYCFYTLVLFALFCGFCFSINKEYEGQPFAYVLKHLTQ